MDPVEKQKKLARAARLVLDSVVALLDATGSEDGQRLRAAVDYVGATVPAEAIRCLERGELAGACIEAAQHVRRRRKR